MRGVTIYHADFHQLALLFPSLVSSPAEAGSGHISGQPSGSTLAPDTHQGYAVPAGGLHALISHFGTCRSHLGELLAQDGIWSDPGICNDLGCYKGFTKKGQHDLFGP